MQPDPLSQPVGALMRPAAVIPTESSLDRAADLMRDGHSFVASADGPYLRGVVTESSLARALAKGATVEQPVSVAHDASVQTIAPHESGAEALRRMVAADAQALLVTDSDHRIFGIISGSDLYPKQVHQVVPNLIGGMATPFGVYLTTGAFGSGVGHIALVSTGALMFGMYLVGRVLAHYAALGIAGGPYPQFAQAVYEFLPLIVFLGALRFLPLSGTHAAEHKVVHAIERGEPLVPEVIKRMPRVHPRCGTNIAVAATLFLSLASWTWIPQQEPRLLLAGLVTLFCWRPLGNFMQKFVTTSPPNDRQIASGIRAGKELLATYQVNRRMPNVLQRIWFSGLVHVMTGSTLAYLLVRGIFSLLKVDIVV